MLEAEKHTVWKNIYSLIDKEFEKFKPLTEKEWKLEDRLEYQKLVNDFADANEWTWLRCR
jgi:hypothetical protein